MEVSDTKIKITFDQRFELDSYDQLDLWSSDIAAQRMTEAVRSLDVDLDNDVLGGSAGREPILQGTFLRDVLLQGFCNPSSQGSIERRQELSITQPGVFSQNHMVQSWAHRYIRPSPIPIPGDPILKDLNESQIKAMALMIGNKISLIQGPPGTGKTRTIAETVKILKAHFQVPQPVLICTYTNVAVDNLIEALIAAGVNPLRVASPGKVKESIAQYSLEAKMEAHRSKPELDKLTKELARLYERRDETFKKYDEYVKSGSLRASKLKTRYEFLIKPRPHFAEDFQARIKRKESALYGICTTCISSASVALNIIDFPVVFLDEASMCMEPASLIPLMKGCQHLALIGDHQQLPPIITSPEALEGGLG
ncbi:hypothetical protein FRC00_014232, partial [Tulasnella sp. 408]